jgi:CubicO group peptidase (beta-lactamase class C family)
MTTACYGLSDPGLGETVTLGTLFSLGSLTKTMVATVIVRLADEGLWSLDDSVSAHVPELQGDGWARTSTLRDLLANRSGLPLRKGLEFGFNARPESDANALRRLAAEVDADIPAAGFWSYSNVGWCLLGRAVETVTGVAWEDTMTKHLRGMGLRETLFVTDPVARARARGHEVMADGATPVEPLRARAYGPAGTTAVSTVSDVLRFAAIHLEDPSLAAMRDAHSEVSIHGWLDSWCLGWARFDWEGARVWGWDGLISGERSILRIIPDQHAAIVLMTNGSTGRAMYRTLFAELVPLQFGVDVPPLRLDPSPRAVSDLSRFSGAYGWPDRRVEVTAAGNGLRIEDDQGIQEALPVDERIFLVDPLDPDNPTVTFDAYDSAGRPQVLYLMLWGLPRINE